MITVQDIKPSEYDEYTAYYLSLAPKGDLHAELEQSKRNVLSFFRSIPPDKHEYRYAAGKWTIKEILQHMIDVERVFAYRALRFARRETVALPGFEVDDYAAASNANRRNLDDLRQEFVTTRMSTQLLFKSFDPEMLQQSGIASGLPLSVRAIGFKLIGHDLHHCNVIRERYLQ